MKLRVEVTAEDIAKGVREKARACPIALAMKRAGVSSPMVAGAAWDVRNNDDDWAVSFGEDGRNETLLPGVCGAFARDFDSGKPVWPFTFEVEVPDEEVSS